MQYSMLPLRWSRGASEPTYSCQATLLPKFTEPLSAWKIGPYVEDYKSGNVKSFRRMLASFIYRGYDNLINLGIGWGPILRWLYDRFQRLHKGSPYPARSGRIPAGSTTPTANIGLQPGDVVRVKSYEEISENPGYQYEESWDGLQRRDGSLLREGSSCPQSCHENHQRKDRKNAAFQEPMYHS